METGPKVGLDNSIVKLLYYIFPSAFLVLSVFYMFFTLQFRKSTESAYSEGWRLRVIVCLSTLNPVKNRRRKTVYVLSMAEPYREPWLDQVG